MLISIALTMHKTVPLGLAASSAPEPVDPLLEEAQVICMAEGAVYSLDREKLAGDHHNFEACSTPFQGSVLVGPVLTATIPQGRLALVCPASFGALKVNYEFGQARSRAPPLIL